MNPLTTFDFEDHVVRSMLINDEPWFIGKDICACLDISKYRDALATLDNDEKGVSSKTGHPSLNQEMIIINEAGLYRLVFRSRKAEAERFKRCLAHEVLPSIRKTGQYRAASIDLDNIDEKLRLVAESRRIFGRKAAQILWDDIGLPPVAQEDDKPAINHNNQLLDYLREFIDQCLIEDPTGRISADEAYKTYCAWAAKAHAPYFTKMHFSRLMVKGIYIRRVKSGTSYYCGYRIVSNIQKSL
ncbi:Bro-N domain-containing protein [Bartonella sp. HY329]|uniref:BRO-N domain-containing protein n=1 Tax=unclassified Bartonella TaxID=2645622 RepID=UPI0021C5682A|nr:MULTISPECIES: Bro-N domain-containing protein [unclassified Bartonella]UXM94341.1 Bro-N domain-containing protein [Bartonella sp. HY329]UXN08664.1 Bro-N domain-containing protein [Bartonella sp. HY328]